MRLPDRIAPGVRVLFVGINPGVRSAVTGHHFAGLSNRFWRLLFDAGLVPEAVGPADDVRLPEWGYGITNLVGRATPGVSALRPRELQAGVGLLLRKVRRYRPAVVAVVGVTVWRELLAAFGDARARTAPMALGFQPLPAAARGARARVPAHIRFCVLPNPSGRNAHHSYAEMLAAFRQLRGGPGQPCTPGAS